MNEIYDKYFDYGPSIGQDINIKYTLVAAASSSNEEVKGTIRKANDTRLIVELNNKNRPKFKIKERWGGLQVHANGGRLGPVQDIIER